MPADILIFAAVAALLGWRLYGVLGTRHGEERQRPDPFTAQPPPPPGGPVVDATARRIEPRPVPDGLAATPEAKEGLNEIALADPQFSAQEFIDGARFAFRLVVESYAKGDIAALESLLTPRLLADFKAGAAARAERGHMSETTVHKITASPITQAHLRGAMAYITVDFDVEETSVTRDSTGTLVDGDPERLFSVHDVWTFSRDIRSADPNWIITETRGA
jgi:predicted lipid-binding transport protein (Tim44 family)